MQQAVCFNCFRYVPEGDVCPYCGYDARKDKGKYVVALKPGTPLANRYVVGRVLGQGGFGVTYVALDSQTRARVAIKEYLPMEFAVRAQDGTSLILNSTDQQEDFNYGKQQFLAEARTLAEFVGSENIVNIHSYFEENGTAYFAMEFMEGVNLKQYMEQHGGPLPVHEANKILMPIMEALDWVHSKGIVHRDISPDNIMIRSDGKAKLIDFGAARQSTGEKSKSLDVVLKHGFAPIEQYNRRGRQGPFTDVYAMAATYYYAITGKVPVDAIERIEEDTLQPPSAFGVKIRKNTEAVLLKALAVSSKDRYQKMLEFYSALLETMPLPFSPEACEENREKERQEMAYREACRLQGTAKTEAEYRAVSRQFERLKGYRDSSERITQCGDAINAMREEQRRQKEEQRKLKEAEAKARAEEKEAKRLAKASTQTQAKKPEPDSDQPKKKKPPALIAAVLAIAILAGIVFGTGILKKNPAVSEPEASTAQTEAVEETPEVQEPAETQEPEPEPEEPDPLKAYKTVGSIVTFGAYEQDNNLENGKEPIEWIVLDVQDGRSLLISKYALDGQRYNTKGAGVTWETCSLRTWLNESFINEAFSSAEQARIPIATATADKNSKYETNPGKDTQDRVFLLSIPEVYEYFDSNEARQCKPTAFAVAQGSNSWWWLRSPGSEYCAAFVSIAGSVNYVGRRVDDNVFAVRPAIWIDLSKIELTTIGNTLTFGSYEQDNDLENGKEPIEWIVLDVQDGRSLLISRYALDYLDIRYGHVNWYQSDMRTWLNDTFVHEAFREEELTRILTATVTADQDPEINTKQGYDTNDRVFLLSSMEAERYFVSNQERQCEATQYAFAQGAYRHPKLGTCKWYLRTMGNEESCAADILDDGSINRRGVRSEFSDDAVRPALWINLDT